MIKQIKFGFTLHDASNLELERAPAELKLSESSPSPSIISEPVLISGMSNLSDS